MAESKLARGESLEIGGYTAVYRSLDERQTANATEIRATLDVTRGDLTSERLRPARTRTRSSSRCPTAGDQSDRLTGEDLFVIAEQIDPDGSVLPGLRTLVNLIWLAGLVFLLGSAITLWPDRREQRRLVALAEAIGLPATR